MLTTRKSIDVKRLQPTYKIHDRIVIFPSLTIPRYPPLQIFDRHSTDFGHPVKNPIDAATHRLGVNICSLVRGEKQRETSSIDRSRLRGGRGRNDGTVGGSWKDVDDEQEGRSRQQIHGERRNVECIARCNPSPSVSDVKSDREARFNGGNRETRRLC